MRWLSLLLVLSTTLSLFARDAVADPARRMLPDAEQKEFAAVGRLNVVGQGYCTATLVARDLVVTAAHCLVDRRTGRVVAADRVHFLAGFRVGSFAAHGRAAEIRLSPGYDIRRRSVGRDMALVRLTAPMPDAIVPFPLGDGVRAHLPFTVVSYGIDRSQIASMERGCRFENRVGPTIYTDCEGVPGVSGAPLLQSAGAGFVVAAVASAVVTRKANANPRGPVLAVEVKRAPRSEGLSVALLHGLN